MLLNSRKSVFAQKVFRKKLTTFSWLLLLIVSATLLGFAQAIQIRTTLEPKTHAEQIIDDVLTKDSGATIVEQTESSLRFRLSDGSYQFVSVIGKLFTQDGMAIDPTLTTTQDGEWIAQTTEGLDYRLKFKADSTRRYYPRKDIDNEYIEIGAPEYLDKDEWEKLPIDNLKIEKNKFYFEEPDYTLEYFVTAYGSKVNLILNNDSFNKPIRWPISFLNLTKKGETLISKQDGKTVAYFAPPRWNDAKELTGDISYTVKDGYLTYTAPDLIDAVYPVTIDPTLQLSITAGGDDYDHGGGSLGSSSTNIYFGYPGGGGTYHGGFQFDSVTILQGSSVSSATMTMISTMGYSGTTINTKISLVDEDNAAAAITTAECTADDAIRTTAKTDWDFTGVSSGNSLTSANFASSVQEVIDRVGWTSGNSLLVHIADDGSAAYYYQVVASWDHATYTEPTLSITYDPPPTVSTLSPIDGATGVSTTANLVITFSEVVDAEAGASNDIVIKKTIDNSTVETIDAQDAKVTGSGTNTITVNPATTLGELTGYYVQIGADAFDDAAGKSYAGISDTTSWNFITATDTTDNYLESVTFDTESSNGFAINSIYWEGTLAAGSTIGFQLAVATSTDFSAVDFLGIDGSVSTIYSATDSDGAEAIPINGAYHHPFESGYRYFRYRVYMDKTSASPEVTKVSINWTK